MVISNMFLFGPWIMHITFVYSFSSNGRHFFSCFFIFWLLTRILSKVKMLPFLFLINLFSKSAFYCFLSSFLVRMQNIWMEQISKTEMSKWNVFDNFCIGKRTKRRFKRIKANKKNFDSIINLYCQVNIIVNLNEWKIFFSQY